MIDRFAGSLSNSMNWLISSGFVDLASAESLGFFGRFDEGVGIQLDGTLGNIVGGTAGTPFREPGHGFVRKFSGQCSEHTTWLFDGEKFGGKLFGRFLIHLCNSSLSIGNR